MTIFAEPSVTLCGERNPSAYAICVREVAGNDGLRHVPSRFGPGDEHHFYPVVDIAKSLATTFTPCQWAKPFPVEFR